MKKLGIVGCGAIGSSLAKAIAEGKAGNVKLISLYDKVFDRALKLVKELKDNIKACKTFNEFLDTKPDFVIEAASQEAVRDYSERILEMGAELMILSVGALLDEALRLKLDSLAKSKGLRIYVPSGAIAGLDGVKATRNSKIYKVTLKTTKNPRALERAPYITEKRIDLKNLKEVKEIFEGTAEEAVKAFPANINVSATLSLAGIGQKRTLVKIIADPKTELNIHEVELEGDFGRIYFKMENKTHPENPATSYLAFLSALQTLNSALSYGLIIGT
ncbi:MAG: aspartate dehydrogenase [Nitrososphaerales archaeon]